MTILTKEQLTYIRRGIQEEVEKDVRIHSGMETETLDLFNRYSRLLKEENPDWIEAETVPSALIRCFDFWKTYFDVSAEQAYEELQAKREAEQERMNAIHEEIMKRNLDELDKLISDMD